MIQGRYMYVFAFMLGNVAAVFKNPVWYWDMLIFMGCGLVGYAIIFIVGTSLELRAKEQKILSDYYKKEKGGK